MREARNPNAAEAAKERRISEGHAQIKKGLRKLSDQCRELSRKNLIDAHPPARKALDRLKGAGVLGGFTGKNFYAYLLEHHQDFIWQAFPEESFKELERLSKMKVGQRK